MPATLPWPKIANTPPNSGTHAVAGVDAQRREIAHQRLRHREPDRAAHARLSVTHLSPSSLHRRVAMPSLTLRAHRASANQRFVILAHARASAPHRRCRRRATRGDGSWKIVRPTAKPRQVRLVARSRNPAASVVDAAQPGRAARTPRQYGSRSAISASTPCHCAGGHRLELPPFRDRCRGCRGASARGARCPARAAGRVGGMISSSSSWPLACTASYSARICASCSSRLSMASSGWYLTRHLTTCSRGQAISVRADRAAAIELERIRARQLDRPADPPAAAGRGVERVLAVAVVAQHADRCRARPSAASVSATASTNSCFSCGDARFVGARFLRELEELVAMVEREREHLVVRRARRGDAMQARQRRILVGPRNLRGVGEKVVELDARRHRRRAAVARDDQRAAGVGVAAAGVVVLAAHPARQEARRERVARAEHVQHFDVDALAVERVVERARESRRRSPRSPAGRA